MQTAHDGPHSRAVLRVFASTARAAVASPGDVLPVMVRVGDAFYGIADAGGYPCIDGIFLPSGTWQSSGCGAILRYGANGKVSVVHLFVPAEGAKPFALRSAADGTLLGITQVGGLHGRGTSFRFDPASGRFTVLQHLGDNAGAPTDPQLIGQRAVAFEDGSVLADLQPLDTFVVLAHGEPARVVYRESGLADGPLVAANESRVAYTAMAAGACDAAWLSVGRDGSFAVDDTNHKPGAPECADGLDSQRAVKQRSDGAVYANDAHRVVVSVPGKPLSVLYANAVPSTALAPESAVIGANGDIVTVETAPQTCGSVVRIRGGVRTVLAKLDGDALCVDQVSSNTRFALAPLGDAVYGTSIDVTQQKSVTFMIPPGKPPTITRAFDRAPTLKEVALAPSVEVVESEGPHPKPVVSWSVDGSLGLPDFTIDPRKVEIEVRSVDRAAAAPLRVKLATTKSIESRRVIMTNEADLLADFRAPLPPLAPGVYAVRVRVRRALRGANGAAIAIVNDGAPAFVRISPLDVIASAHDPELATLRATFVHRAAIAGDAFAVSCDGSAGSFAPKGERLQVASIDRNRASAVVTGFGPRGTLMPAAGDASAFGPFTTLDPLTVTFEPLASDCQKPSAVFAAASDVTRDLEVAR